MKGFKSYERYKDSGIGWIGEIPEHWYFSRFKNFVKAINEKIESNRRNNLQYVGLENIESFTGKLIEGTSENPAEGISNIFYTSDVLFGKLRPYLAKVLLPSFNGRCSTELLVLRPIDTSIIGRTYLYYYCLSDGFINIVNSSTYGVKMPRANWDFISLLPLIVPSLREQQAIANFLDQKTAEIDSLINDRERLIELLQEQRQAIITQVVTKGLDSNVPMKDSEVEWIGEIPKHWNTKKMGWVFDLIGSGTTPDSQRTEYYDGYIPWVNSGELKDCFIDDTNNKVTERAIQDHSMLRTYPKGSLIIALYGATIGKLGILNINATVNQACCVMSYPKKDIDVKFIFYWLLANREFLISQGYGGGQSNISQEIIKQLRIPFPSLAEQQAIAYFLDQKTTKIDLLISDIRTQISFLKEYRQSLITAAVTGKIDVRNYFNAGEEKEEQVEVS